MTTNASRAPVDFDAFARDLQQPQAPASAQAAQKSDPLAELARIVGQDDPFRALLEARDSRAPAAAQPARIEPSFYDGGHQSEAAHGYPAQQSPADAFDQYLASVEHGAYPDESHDANGAEAVLPEESRESRALDRPRHRSRLVSVGAGLAVVAVAVTGALTWRSLNSGGSSGSVPTIMADTAPMKIAPKTADGVEIPDQNKQIYDRSAKDGQIRVVNREEQPIDVAQAARSAQRDSGAVTPGGSGATPGASGTLTESLGEPRRVRTVTVKPDTPPPPPQREAEAATATPSVIPTMTLPGAEGGQTAVSMRPRPNRTSAPAPAPVAEAPAPAEPAPAPAAPAPRAKPPQRVAAIAPDSTAALPDAPAKVAQPPVGGFSVQLGVRTSEGEAKAAFKQMQGKYSQLSGQPALIRQAEVNGKTIYRVRVGPLAKAEATTLCAELQGAGGQCFVAKN